MCCLEHRRETADEAAEYLSISAETLRRFCRRKAVTFIQITSSEYRFSREDLNEYAFSMVWALAKNSGLPLEVLASAF